MNQKYIQQKKMLKDIVKIQYNSDFTLNCKLPNGYDGQDFIIRLYTTDKSSYFEASYLNGEYSNCLADDNKNVVVYVNNHNLQPGCLHVGLQIDYANTHFQDNIENIITAEETNVYLVKQNANATSAMYVGSALPDLTGSSDFITQSDLEFELLNYYTKEDIDNASYISSADLNDFVTEEELNDMGFLSQSQLDAMGYATVSYVDTKTSQKQDRLINGVNIKTVNGYSLLGNGDLVIEGGGSAIDMSAYVTHTFLENQAYVTQSALNNASYVTESQLQQAGYATESYVSDYVSQHAPTPDLSAYVTKTELSNAGYITTSDVSQMGYVTGSDLSNMGYITSIPSEYVTESELSAKGYITSIPSEYVTQSELSGMGYLTAIPSEYVTESELSAKSYATTTQLTTKQDTLVSGTNIKTVNNNSLLGSGNITISSSGNLIAEVTTAEYEAMQQAGTLDPNTIYVITDAPATDLSYYAELTYVDTYYVSKEQLNSAGYITSIPNTYATYAAISNMGYVSQSQLNQAGYLTSIPNTYATYAAISNMGYLTSANFIYDSTTYTLTISI